MKRKFYIWEGSFKNFKDVRLKKNGIGFNGKYHLNNIKKEYEQIDKQVKQNKKSIIQANKKLINITDAKYLETAMDESSKGHWVNGFDVHPDEKFEGCGPCTGVAEVLKQRDNQAYTSIGDHIVKPWFQTIVAFVPTTY